MDFELHVVKGRSATQALKLLDGVNVVGRLDDCTIRIKSSQVSRKHCELFQKQGKLLVKDLKSANGTFVNGKKVEGQKVLEPGDELTIGSIRLRVAKIGQVPPLRPAAEAKASDTAVAAVVPASDDDEFEIEFDDEPTAAVVADEDIEIEFDDEPLAVEIDQPAPVPPPAAAAPAQPEKPKAAEPKKSPAPASPPTEPAPELADEAIADFLLDIKLDEED